MFDKLKKIELDDIYVVYLSREDISVIKQDYRRDDIIFHTRNTITITNDIKLVTKNENHFVDLITKKKIPVYAPDSSYEGKEAHYDENAIKKEKNNYSYPVKLKELLKEDNIKNQRIIKTKDVDNILETLKKQLPKKQTLSFNELIASKQIYDFTKYKTNKLLEDETLVATVNRIESLIEKTDEETKFYIERKLNHIINEYNNKKESLKPSFQNSDNMSLENIQILKNTTISKLEKLYYSLSDKIELLKELDDLNKCKKILETKKIHPGESIIINKINFIISNIKYQPVEKQKVIVEELQELVEEELKKSKEKLDTITNNDEIVLTTGKDKTIKDNINQVSDKYFFDTEKATLFLNLLNILDDNNIEEYKDSSDMKDMFNNIGIILNKIPNSEYKEELERNYNNLKKKYSDSLKNIINDKELLKNTNYSKIENNLREELQVFIQSINTYSHLKKYNENNSLLDQLLKSKEIIYKGNQEIIDNKEVITNMVNEIVNFVNSNQLLEEQDRKKIKQKLEEVIEDKIIKLKETKITKQKDYLKTQYDIIRSLTSIKLDIDDYKKSLNEYNASKIK